MVLSDNGKIRRPKLSANFEPTGGRPNGKVRPKRPDTGKKRRAGSVREVISAPGLASVKVGMGTRLNPNFNTRVKSSRAETREEKMTEQVAQVSIEGRVAVNVNKLGEYLDGWADLVEGMGSKATQVSAKTLQYLNDREMPEVKVEEVKGTVSVTEKGRPYLLTSVYPSAKTSVYIGEHGKDLYVSWRTFIQPTLNLGILLLTGFLAVVFGWYLDSSHFFDFGESAIFGFIVEIILIAFAGRLFKGSFAAYFLIEPHIFHAESITAMSLSVHKSLLRALDESGIDVSKLRLKRDFKGGRRGEEI